MKRLIHFIIATVFTLSALLFSGCNWQEIPYGMPHPVFSTEYTQEEHIERIALQTGYVLWEDLRDSKIEDIDVEILYAFYDEDPEYFLVEVEYKEEFTVTYGKNDSTTYTTKYKHLIGSIFRDEYYYVTEFFSGRSPYSIAGYKDAKKYFGRDVDYVCGVQTDDGVLKIYEYGNGPVNFSKPEQFEQKLIPEEDLEDYRIFYPPWVKRYAGYSEFETKLTAEQHVDELTYITNKKYKDELDDNVLKDFTVEMVYSMYTSKPEYFLIEFEYFEEREIAYSYTNPDDPEERLSAIFKTKYQHILGKIYDDNYYVLSPYYYYVYEDVRNPETVYRFGKNAYALAGYQDAKKYYDVGKLAVQTDEGLLQIYDHAYEVSSSIMQKDDPRDAENKRFQTKLIDEFAVYYEAAFEHSYYPNIKTKYE